MGFSIVCPLSRIFVTWPQTCFMENNGRHFAPVSHNAIVMLIFGLPALVPLTDGNKGGPTVLFNEIRAFEYGTSAMRVCVS